MVCGLMSRRMDTYLMYCMYVHGWIVKVLRMCGWLVWMDTV